MLCSGTIAADFAVATDEREDFIARTARRLYLVALNAPTEGNPVRWTAEDSLHNAYPLAYAGDASLPRG